MQLPGWYRVWLLFSLHISSSKIHLFLNVVELDEHTGSSYEGQFSSHTQRASNASNALQTAKYSHVTLMHGSRSLDSIKYSNIVSFFSIFKASVKRSIFKTRKDWVFWYVFYLCQPFKTLINHEFLNIPCYLKQSMSKALSKFLFNAYLQWQCSRQLLDRDSYLFPGCPWHKP